MPSEPSKLSGVARLVRADGPQEDVVVLDEGFPLAVEGGADLGLAIRWAREPHRARRGLPVLRRPAPGPARVDRSLLAASAGAASAAYLRRGWLVLEAVGWVAAFARRHGVLIVGRGAASAGGGRWERVALGAGVLGEIALPKEADGAELNGTFVVQEGERAGRVSRAASSAATPSTGRGREGQREAGVLAAGGRS